MAGWIRYNPNTGIIDSSSAIDISSIVTEGGNGQPIVIKVGGNASVGDTIVNGGATLNDDFEASSYAAGDINRNGRFDSGDFAALQAFIAAAPLPPYDPGYDLNGDGVIDGADVAILKELLGITGCLADVASDSSDTLRTPNGTVGGEDLESFVNAFADVNVFVADVASDASDSEYNPNGAVGPEDLEAFINAFIGGC